MAVDATVGVVVSEPMILAAPGKRGRLEPYAARSLALPTVSAA